MIKKINFKVAVNIILFFMLAVLIYHLLIITGILPYSNTWGGRLTSYKQMIVFESISITVNIILGWIVGMKGKYFPRKISIRLINGILWFMVFIFLLNTIGNIAAISIYETLIAAPLTLLLSILCYRLVKEPN